MEDPSKVLAVPPVRGYSLRASPSTAWIASSASASCLRNVWMSPGGARRAPARRPRLTNGHDVIRMPIAFGQPAHEDDLSARADRRGDPVERLHRGRSPERVVELASQGSGRAGARCRRCRRSVSPTRLPNRTCPFPSIRLSTGRAMADRDAGSCNGGLRPGGGLACSGGRPRRGDAVAAILVRRR